MDFERVGMYKGSVCYKVTTLTQYMALEGRENDNNIYFIFKNDRYYAIKNGRIIGTADTKFSRLDPVKEVAWETLFTAEIEAARVKAAADKTVQDTAQQRAALGASAQLVTERVALESYVKEGADRLAAMVEQGKAGRAKILNKKPKANG